MGLTVLNPGLLILGLACIAIPILVHMIRRKHRPVSWGAMRFLEQAYRKRRRRMTLEQLILLLLRCAIIGLIAAAVGSLVLGSGLTDQRARTLVIVMDNSIHSASTLTDGSSPIESHKARALELLSTLDASKGDRAALITLAAPARGDAIPATNELGLIRSSIDKIQSTEADRDLPGAMALLTKSLGDDNGSAAIEPVFMLSPSGWDRDSPLDLGLIGQENSLIQEVHIDVAGPVSTSSDSPSTNSSTLESSAQQILNLRPNISILDAAPLRPVVLRKNPARIESQSTLESQDEIQGVRVTLARSDTQSAGSTTITLTDVVDGSVLATRDVQWGAGQSQAQQSIPINPDNLVPARGGSALIRASINHLGNQQNIQQNSGQTNRISTPDNSNALDDSRIVGIPVRQYLNVGIIDVFTDADSTSILPSRWVRAVLGAQDSVVSVQQINARSASQRLDPTLDILFILSPSSLDDQSWDRIASLNRSGTPMIITPSTSIAESAQESWLPKLEILAPSLLSAPPTIKAHDTPIGLSRELVDDQTDARLNPSTHLLSGITDEYPTLASSVTINQQLVLAPGEGARVLMRDSLGTPIMIISDQETQRSEPYERGPVVFMGVALDAQWTDLPARPLFVALIHELQRSLLARTIAPKVRIAGLSAEGVMQGNLEPMNGWNGLSANAQATGQAVGQALSSPSSARTYIELDAQGAGVGSVIINPDARLTTLATSESAQATEMFASAFRLISSDIQMNALSASESISDQRFGASATQGRSIALICFAIALLLGVCEFLLARRCSYQAVIVPPARGEAP
ncbi:MAG: BatA domain-containing protein [Phycisphaerales bacterium]